MGFCRKVQDTFLKSFTLNTGRNLSAGLPIKFGICTHLQNLLKFGRAYLVINNQYGILSTKKVNIMNLLQLIKYPLVYLKQFKLKVYVMLLVSIAD